MLLLLANEWLKARCDATDLIAGIDLIQQEAAIRELVNQEASPVSVLRLLCLYCLVAGGIKPKQSEDLQRDFLQTYGYGYLPTLVHLADLSLLFKSSGTKAPFAVCRRPLRLVVDDVDESAPEDISYVYSGYAPVSVRLVQHAVGLGATSGGLVGGIAGAGARERNGATLNGWKGLDDVLNALPGRIFEEIQKPEEQNKRTRKFLSAVQNGPIVPQLISGSLLADSYAQDQVPVTVVCFLGGCTYTEIAALRFTSQRLTGRKLVIVTTGILNGGSIMDSLGPPRTPNGK